MVVNFPGAASFGATTTICDRKEGNDHHLYPVMGEGTMERCLI